MASVTIDASLNAAASMTFPFSFPSEFGPMASAHRLALVDMAMAVTASRTAHFASAVICDASLAATLTPTALINQHAYAGASVGVTASPASGGDGGSAQEKGNASLALTATPSSNTKLAGLVKGSLAATLTSSSAIIRGPVVIASQTITSTTAATAHRNAIVAAVLAATLSPVASMGKHWTAGASLGIAASLRAGTGNVYYLDAALVISTDDTFPYTFPFIFQTSTDQMIAGRGVDATTVVTAAPTATATRGAVAHISLPVTFTPSAVLLIGTEKMAAASVGVTAAPTASATVDHVVGAQLPATASAAAVVSHGSLLDASSLVSITAVADTRWDALVDAALAIGAESSPGANMSSLIAVSLPVELAPEAAGTRGVIIDAEALGVLLSSAGNVIQDLFINAGLDVSVSIHATAPESMPFFPYFLR